MSDAETQAAWSTINYVTTFGFDTLNRAVQFNVSYNMTNANGTAEQSVITVPLLAILPVPAMKVSKPQTLTTVTSARATCMC